MPGHRVGPLRVSDPGPLQQREPFLGGRQRPRHLCDLRRRLNGLMQSRPPSDDSQHQARRGRKPRDASRRHRVPLGSARTDRGDFAGGCRQFPSGLRFDTCTQGGGQGFLRKIPASITAAAMRSMSCGSASGCCASSRSSSDCSAEVTPSVALFRQQIEQTLVTQECIAHDRDPPAGSAPTFPSVREPR